MTRCALYAAQLREVVQRKTGSEMSDPNKYAKLLEPGQIGKVKTRNRIYKSAAGMHSFNEDEFDSMNDNTLGFYEGSGEGRSRHNRRRSAHCGLPAGLSMALPLSDGRRQVHPGMKQLVDLIHSHGCPTFMQMEHDGPWQNPLFPNHPPTYEGPPIGASAVNIPLPGDFHRDMIRPLTVPEIEEITEVHQRGRAGTEGRLRRCRHQCGQHPHHYELHVAVVESPR